MPPRLIRLTERQPRVVRLHRDDVDFLLAHHRRHFYVEPTGNAGRYQLWALSVAGVLVLPHATLAIRPKIPATDLWRLLAPLVPPPADLGLTEAVRADRMPQLLAGRFAELLTERVTAGLRRDYGERTESGPLLRGRLDAARQAREQAGRRDRLHGLVDDFTPDLPCNQLPRAVAEALLSRSDINSRTRAALTAALSAFDGVRLLPLTIDLCDATGRELWRDQGYRSVIIVSQLIAKGLIAGLTAGETAGPTFLLDLDKAWEDFVRASALSALTGSAESWSFAPWPYLLASPPVAGRPDLHVRPDMMVLLDSKPQAPIDAKWKRLPDKSLITDDAYQVLAYAAALGAPRAVLVYPGKCNRVWDYPTAGPRLEVVTLRIAGAPAVDHRSRRRLRNLFYRQP
jgi:hypothetical protein